MTDGYLQAGLPTSPIPVIDPETSPYWDGAEEGRLILPFCLECDDYFWYPRGFCPRCSGSKLRWDQAVGTGAVYSFTIVRRSFGIWKEHLPFSVAWVTLEEGISVATNIVGIMAEQLTIGLEVRAVFEQSNLGEPAILRFTPIGPHGADA